MSLLLRLAGRVELLRRECPISRIFPIFAHAHSSTRLCENLAGTDSGAAQGALASGIMMHIAGHDRSQTLLLPESLDEYVGPENSVRFIEAFRWAGSDCGGICPKGSKPSGSPSSPSGGPSSPSIRSRSRVTRQNRHGGRRRSYRRRCGRCYSRAGRRRWPRSYMCPQPR
jgi:hypothetical protein